MLESVNKKNVLFIYFALILSTLLVYWQVGNFDFLNYDDDDYVYENPHVLNGLTPNGILWAFTTNHAGNWHPLTWLSLMLDCQLFGNHPGWMHRVNLFLHLANTLLLFTVLRKMTAAIWPSAFVAAAFALHPMHVESVVWISERKDVLSALFLLLTLAAYLNYVRQRGFFRYLLVVLLFAAGLLAKPMLVTLPFLLLLLDYWPLGRLYPPPAGRGDDRSFLYPVLLEKIPFFVLSVVSSAITFLVQSTGGAVSNLDILPLRIRLANVFMSYAKYIGKLFWPENLGVFYPFEPDQFTFWRIALCVLLILIISILVIDRRSAQKYLPVGWFWFLGTLVPVIGLVQVGNQAYADRYTYIPYIGLLIMAAWGLPELFSGWPHRKIILGSLMAAILAVFGVDAFWQAGYWKHGILLYTRTIEVTRGNYIIYNNLGILYGRQGRFKEAVETLNHVLAIRPNDAEAHNNLGVIYDRLGRWQDAVEHFNRALEIKPRFHNALKNLGILYGKQGQFKEAVETLNHALAIRPNDADTHNNLGVIYDRLGQWQDAVEHFNRALEIRPRFHKAINNLGVTDIKLGRLDEAIDNFRQAVQIKPDYAEAYNNLGDACRRANLLKEAAEAFEQAIKIRTDYAEAYTNLGIVYSGLGRQQDAIEAHLRAIQIRPDYAEAYNNLGAVYNDLGRSEEAIKAFNDALQINPDCVEAYMNLGMLYSGLGRQAEAVDAYKRAIRIKPDYAEACYSLAGEFMLQGRLDEALEQYHAALRLRPDWPVLMNNIALLIAANPQIRNRDVNEAIRLASRACEITNNENPVFLGTLAAAFAADGKFSEAVDMANRALKLAEAANQIQIKNIIQQHLSLYEQGKPYIEPAPDSGKQ